MGSTAHLRAVLRLQRLDRLRPSATRTFGAARGSLLNAVRYVARCRAPWARRKWSRAAGRVGIPSNLRRRRTDARADSLRRSPIPSCCAWARYEVAWAPDRSEISRWSRARHSTPCRPRRTSAPPPGKSQSAPAPDRLPGRRENGRPAARPWPAPAREDRPGRYLRPPCAPDAAPDTCDLRRLRAFSPANTAPHRRLSLIHISEPTRQAEISY